MRRFMICIFNLFGDSAELARQAPLSARAHRLACRWLNAAEHFLRHLLLIEAAALPTPPPASRPARTRAACTATPVSYDPERPEQWRVSFVAFPSQRRRTAAHGGRHVRTHEERDAWEAHKLRGFLYVEMLPPAQYATNKTAARAAPRYNAMPLALRAEAMLRAFNDPAPYARRLARRLARHPERAFGLACLPADTTLLIGGEFAFAAAAPAHAAARHFNDSG